MLVYVSFIVSTYYAYMKLACVADGAFVAEVA